MKSCYICIKWLKGIFLVSNKNLGLCLCMYHSFQAITKTEDAKMEEEKGTGTETLLCDIQNISFVHTDIPWKREQ